MGARAPKTIFFFFFFLKKKYLAGVRPWRRITAPIAAGSGGPPTASAMTAATSWKYAGPSSPGVTTARNLASAS